MGTKIRVMFEADDVDAGTMGRLMEMIDGRNRMPATPVAVASLPVVTPAPALPSAPTQMTERPARAATKAKRGGRVARLLVSKDFPGRTFTAEQVKKMCGVSQGTYLGTYITKGIRVGGKHLFTYADETPTDATTTAAEGADGDTDDAGEEEDGGDDDDDPPDAKPDAKLWLELKVCPSVRKRVDRAKHATRLQTRKQPPQSPAA